MRVILEILQRLDLDNPDGRPLYDYEITDEELAKLEALLPLRVGSGQVLASTGQAFVVWAAEHLRRRHSGGPLAWKIVFDRLGLAEDQALARELTREGLRLWRRNLRASEAGTQLFLYTLMAEGGLPDALLAEAGRFRAVLIGLVQEIEAEGALGASVAEAAAQRRTAELPQAFRHEDTVRLLGDLALGVVAARAALPGDLPAEAAVGWLDAQHPGWRNALPLRLSPQALEALVRPALAADRAREVAEDVPLRRLLRRRSDGAGWIGLAAIAEEALLPSGIFERGHGERRLRLLAETGDAFMGMPEAGGYRLRRTGGRGPAMLPIAPDEAAVLSVHVDGRSLGEVVLDPGMPSPHEAPSLWRGVDPLASDDEELVPLPGRGRTRGRRIWLLAPADASPRLAPGIDGATPVPGPGGLLWPLSGKGVVEVQGHRLGLSTGEERDDPPARLMAFGPLLDGWTCAGGGPAYAGNPQIFGVEGEGQLRPVERQLRRRQLQRLLGGEIVEWTEQQTVLARLRLIVLPKALRLRIRELAAGTLSLSAEGLGAGWHVALLTEEGQTRGVADEDGALELSLSLSGLIPSYVRLALSSPEGGARLELAAPWPSRSALILEPGGERLERNRQLSVGRLAGWRGWLPETGGAVQLRLAKSGGTVAFQAASTVRLAAYEPVVRQMLALAGPDARVNLCLAAGQETSRLELGRSDWASEDAGPFRHLGPGRVRLSAVDLLDPERTCAIEAEGRVDLTGWLGDGEALWFVQGASDCRGIMRPLVWTPRIMSLGTREERIAWFVEEWRRLLRSPDDAGWNRLWTLVTAVREGGEAGALDQVTALGQVPEAAVALLFRRKRIEVAAVLALETEAPLWWPIVSCAAWSAGLSHGFERLLGQLSSAGFAEAEARRAAEQTVAAQAGAIVAQRPEVCVHLGQALAAIGLSPLAQDTDGAPVPLAVPSPAGKLEALAQEAARRFDGLPQGVTGVSAHRLRVAPQLAESLRPLIDAPCVAAEVAAGIACTPGADDVLALLALRAADPAWFDAALPAALSLALEIGR